MSQYVKRPGETITLAVNFRDKLAQTVSTAWAPACRGTTEHLTGTPTAEELYGADLTIDNVAVLTTGRWTGGRLINANEGVELSVAGGTMRTAYTIRVSTATDATPTQTLVQDIRLLIL